jgi:hypothetical protein
VRTTVNVFVEWRVTAATQFKFLELIHEYEQVDENSDEAEAIREMIKSLPNYPRSAPVDSDIRLVVTDLQN